LCFWRGGGSLMLMSPAPNTPAGRRPVSDVLVLRPARQADARALRRLAALDSAEPLEGEALVAELGGTIVAAHELHGPRAIADPFVPTADLAGLLEARLALLQREETGERRQLRRLPRLLAAR
jgi:hypothetical protein